MSDDAADSPAPTALGSLRVFARSSVAIADGLDHVEIYTPHGLLTWFVHRPPTTSAAIVTCGGAMGGVLGPGHGLYHVLGERWREHGVATYRVGYRILNDLDHCAHDVACAVETAIADGAERVVAMGHSFGGAAAIRAAVVMQREIDGVVTFATQSGGCEVAGGLAGRPLLLFHGDRDEILGVENSEMVRMIAGSGDLVVLPNDGHLLGRSDDTILERLDRWLPDVLNIRAA